MFTVWHVLAVATITDLATGLGALPFLVVRRVSAQWQGAMYALSGGLMLGASAGLAVEGFRLNLFGIIVGALLGIAFIEFGRRLIPENIMFAALTGEAAQKALVIVGVMTIHSAAEGVAVGVAFGGGARLAALIPLAIAVHNIPEGLAISAVLHSKGKGLLSCIWWSVFSSIPQPLLAVPAYLFVEWFRPGLPYGLGFAGGAMVYMVVRELWPDAVKALPRPAVLAIMGGGLVAMYLFQHWLG